MHLLLLCSLPLLLCLKMVILKTAKVILDRRIYRLDKLLSNTWMRILQQTTWTTIKWYRRLLSNKYRLVLKATKDLQRQSLHLLLSDPRQHQSKQRKTDLNCLRLQHLKWAINKWCKDKTTCSSSSSKWCRHHPWRCNNNNLLCKCNNNSSNLLCKCSHRHLWWAVEVEDRLLLQEVDLNLWVVDEQFKKYTNFKHTTPWNN